MTPYRSLIAIFAAALIACSSSGSNDDETADSIAVEKQMTIDPADSSAYKLGCRHAIQLLDQCSSVNEIRSQLLDLRAREHIIRTQISESSADAYVYGIESTISENCDSLAYISR
ncbi:MAG: hypothetical protein NC111_05755 [Bacteroides sp.]|nr:hypothetical protein [Bacteroides sp.]MCM1414192.1 hypothetical protein [Bacteroides sp.]MCM1472014.1 hypothetical protein [Bacteroides sp.]